MINKPASLGDIAKKLKVRKESLHYYVSLGIINPVARVGNMNLFELDDAVEKISSIKKTSKQNNISLKDLAENKK